MLGGEGNEWSGMVGGSVGKGERGEEVGVGQKRREISTHIVRFIEK